MAAAGKAFAKIELNCILEYKRCSAIDRLRKEGDYCNTLKNMRDLLKTKWIVAFNTGIFFWVDWVCEVEWKVDFKKVSLSKLIYRGIYIYN